MSTIKPGRETDALVAEKLGWTRVPGDWIGIVWRTPPDKSGSTIQSDRTFQPSTVPADALAALEATGRPWCVMKCGEDEKGWTTAAYIARITDPEMEWAEAPTLCLAACMAILQLPAGRGEGEK